MFSQFLPRSLKLLRQAMLGQMLLLLAACGPEEKTAVSGANQKPVVYVSIPPFASLAERIAGDDFEVRSLSTEHDDPHVFSPTPKEVSAVSTAKLYISSGLPFEKILVETLAALEDGPSIIDLTEVLSLRSYGEGEHEHHEGDGHHHHHDHHHHDDELDPHIWLAPRLLVDQVTAMGDAIAAIAPSSESAEAVNERVLQLSWEITQIDAELEQALAPYRGQVFHVYHGAFGYFADSYGLVQKSVEINGRSPGPKQLAELVQQAKADGTKVIFVQPQFDTNSAKALAEAIQGTVLTIDPLKRDVLANLREIGEKISVHSKSTTSHPR